MARWAGDMTEEEQVWQQWNALPPDCQRPVHTIAHALGLTTAAVAAIVYPAAVFGEWSDEQEPQGWGVTGPRQPPRPRPDWSRFGLEDREPPP